MNNHLFIDQEDIPAINGIAQSLNSSDDGKNTSVYRMYALVVLSELVSKYTKHKIYTDIKILDRLEFMTNDLDIPFNADICNADFTVHYNNFCDAIIDSIQIYRNRSERRLLFLMDLKLHYDRLLGAIMEKNKFINANEFGAIMGMLN